MNYTEALWLATRLQQALPDHLVKAGQVAQRIGWYVQVQERIGDDWITLPDALSVQAYLDARRGYRTEAGAPDFGPGRV